MSQLFAVFREWGEAWDISVPASGQAHWDAHRACLAALADRGVLEAGGPFEGTREVMLLVRAASEEEAEREVAADPWTRHGLLRTTRIMRWRVAAGAAAGLRS